MSNAKVAQDRIWAFHDGPWVGYFVGQSPGEGAYVAEFIRADLVKPLTDAQRQREEAIVRKALERAAVDVSNWGSLMCGHEDVTLEIISDIRALASDPEAVAEIIAAAAKEGRG